MRESVRLERPLQLTPAGLRIDEGQDGVTTLVQTVTASPSGRVPGEAIDFVVAVGLPVHPKLLEWIAGSWDDTPPSHDGAVLTCDRSYIVRRERDFHAARVAETAFPALDGAVKEPLFLNVRIAPTRTEPDREASQPQHLGPPGPFAQVGGMTANFRVHVDGLDTSGVTRVESFAIRRSIERIAARAGDIELRFGPVEFPILRFQLSPMSSPAWVAWYQDFVVKGNNGPAYQKAGSIDLLAPDMQTVRLHLELAGLGIVGLVAPANAPERPEVIERYEADLRCDQMKLTAG